MTNLRVYHIVNGETTYHLVENPHHAKVLIDALAKSDLLDHSIDYNVFGLEEYNKETKRWEEWYDENGDDIDNSSLINDSYIHLPVHKMDKLSKEEYLKYNPTGETLYGLYVTENEHIPVICEVGLMSKEEKRKLGNDWLGCSGIIKGTNQCYLYSLHRTKKGLYKTPEMVEKDFNNGKLKIENAWAL